MEREEVEKYGDLAKYRELEALVATLCIGYEARVCPVEIIG